MTTQQGQGQQPQAPPTTEGEMIAKVAVILETAATLAYTTAAIRAVIRSLHLPSSVVEAAVKIATAKPVGVTPTMALIRYRVRNPKGSLGRPLGGFEDYVVSPKDLKKYRSASEVTRSAEFTFRAGFLINSAKRIYRAITDGSTFSAALQKERVYWVQHLDAQDRRAVAAGLVDQAAKAYGALMGWHAKMDDRTSAECRAADGHNFRVDRRPIIGYPGTVHPNCRCESGAPFEGVGSVNSALLGTIDVLRPRYRPQAHASRVRIA